MKNGMNRIDIKEAHQLVMYGWTPPQVSRKLKIKLTVVEAWWNDLTEDGYAAYREKQRAEREAATRITESISAETAVQMAREQILMEEKIRAEVRAEMAAEAAAHQRLLEAESLLENPIDAPEPEVKKAKADETEEAKVEPSPDKVPADAEPQRATTAKSRRRRKAADE